MSEGGGGATKGLAEGLSLEPLQACIQNMFKVCAHQNSKSQFAIVVIALVR